MTMTNMDEDARNPLLHEEVCYLPLTGWHAIKLKIDIAIFVTAMASVAAFAVISIVATSGREKTRFLMELAAFEALNATTLGRHTTVSPAFTLKMRVESPGALQSWCSNGGEEVVSYSGVALAWGKLPGFCVRGNALPAMQFTVKAWGRGVGLSEDLRRRLDAERRAGAAQVLVHLKLFYSPNWVRPTDEICGTSLHSYQFNLTGGTREGQ